MKPWLAGGNTFLENDCYIEDNINIIQFLKSKESNQEYQDLLEDIEAIQNTKWRKALLLRFRDDLSRPEIAKLMNISENTVRHYLYQGTILLRKQNNG